MPLGTQVRTITGPPLVGLTAVPATPVGGLISLDWTENTPSVERRYIGQGAAIALGATARTITLVCDYETGDTGQLLLHDAVESQANVYTKWTPNGTDGETLICKYTRNMSAPDADGYVTVTFTGVQQVAPTVVAGGFGT